MCAWTKHGNASMSYIGPRPANAVKLGMGSTKRPSIRFRFRHFPGGRAIDKTLLKPQIEAKTVGNYPISYGR